VHWVNLPHASVVAHSQISWATGLAASNHGTSMFADVFGGIGAQENVKSIFLRKENASKKGLGN
jgi:hypothetical protein